MNKKQIPCYLPNGGTHQIVNVPLGIFTRAELRRLVRELLDHHKQLGTFIAAEATPRVLSLLNGLHVILGLNLKPAAVRRKAAYWYAANEKNLKRLAVNEETGEVVDLVKVAASFGLIAIIFLIVAHLDYLQATM